MPSVGRLQIDAVENGIELTLGLQKIVLTPKEARNLDKVLQNLIPRIRDIQKDKFKNQINEFETKISDLKRKIELLDEVAKAEEKEGADKDIRIG